MRKSVHGVQLRPRTDGPAESMGREERANRWQVGLKWGFSAQSVLRFWNCVNSAHMQEMVIKNEWGGAGRLSRVTA